MRLNDALITNERYRGEPSTDEDGKTTWPIHVLWDDEVPGLGLRIFPSVRGRPSRKDFLVTWKIGIKSRTMAIGTFGVDCTLRQARRTAREALDLARRGQDPIEARHRALGIGTNEDLASRFLFEHSAAKKKPAPGAEQTPTAPAGEALDAAAPSPSPEAALEGAAPDASQAFEAPTGVESQLGEAAPRSEADEAVPETASVPDALAFAPAASDPSEVVTAAGTSPATRVESPPSPPAAAIPSPVAVPPRTPAAPRVHAPSAAAPRAAAPPAATITEVPSLAALVSDHAARKSETPPAPKRGPTKVRLLPVPEALHKEIERRSRSGGMTISAYLQTLVDLETAVSAVRGGNAGRQFASEPREDNASASDETGEAESGQTVDVAALMGDSFDPEP